MAKEARQVKMFSPGQVTPQWVRDRLEDARYVQNEWTRSDMYRRLYQLVTEAILEQRCDHWRECLREINKWQ